MSTNTRAAAPAQSDGRMEREASAASASAYPAAQAPVKPVCSTCGQVRPACEWCDEAAEPGGCDKCGLALCQQHAAVVIVGRISYVVCPDCLVTLESFAGIR